LGSTVVQFSFFVILSLVLHLLCLSFKLELPVTTECSRSSEIGYVSRSVESFLPRLEPVIKKNTKKPLNITTNRRPGAGKSDISSAPALFNPKKRTLPTKAACLPLPQSLPDLSHRQNVKQSADAASVFHKPQPAVVTRTPVVVKNQVNMKAENLSPPPFAGKATSSSDSKPSGQLQDLSVAHHRPPGPVLQNDEHKSAVFQAALPCYADNPPPEYPEVARRRGWEGTVKFEVQVLETGRVGQLNILEPSGHESLDRAARRSIRRWVFKPATSLGVPVASRVVVPIDFVLGH